MSRPGFEHPTLRMQGESSNQLRHQWGQIYSDIKGRVYYGLRHHNYNYLDAAFKTKQVDGNETSVVTANFTIRAKGYVCNQS